MASLCQRKKSRFWVACYTDRTGRQIKRSTKTTNKAAALKMALELERVEHMAREGRASAFQFQHIISEVTKEVTGESLPSPSVKDYFNDWLDGIKRKNSPTTVERYANSVRLFLEGLGPAATQPLRILTPQHIEQFLRRRLDAGVAPKTAIVDVKALSCALRRAENFQLIHKNPVPAVKLPKNVSSVREVFTSEEVQKLLAAAPNQEWQTVILIGFYLGARLSDCIMMHWDNVNTVDGLISYDQKKTGKRVVVPVHFHLVKHLLKLSESHTEGFLCPSLAAKKPGGKHGLSESFKRIVKRAGLDLMIIKGKGTRNFTRRSFHSLRHSFSSALANAGVPEETRMKLTGHASREMHARYTHINLEPLKQAINSLPVMKGKTPG